MLSAILRGVLRYLAWTYRVALDSLRWTGGLD